MKIAKEYAKKQTFNDSFGVDTIHIDSVENIIELAHNEGVLLGLKLCKEMFAQGTISHENITENETYYKELLQNIIKEL